MSFNSWVERIKWRRKRAKGSVRLELELMEDRTVPAQAVAVGPDLSLYAPGANTGTHVGDSIYFIAHQSTDPAGVSEIWQVSGSATAQQLSVPALAGMSLGEIANINSTLYVTASPAPSNPPTMSPMISTGTNLWKIDPTAPGGADELTNFTGSAATSLETVGNELLFTQTPLTGPILSSSGNQLWASDGTIAGTQMIYTFTGGAQPNLSNAVAAGGDLYFPVSSSISATPPALWMSDGTAAGTQAVTAVGGGTIAPLADSTLATLGNAVFFSTSDGTQAQLWTAVNGQASVVQSFAASTSTGTVPFISGLTAANGNVYFALTSDSGPEVWTSDGTTAGTTPVYQPPAGTPAPTGAYVGDITVLNGSVYFTLVNGGGLMEADGQGGATPVPLPAGLSSPAFISAVGGRLYFQADDGIHGTELWSTDGTAGGVVRMTDINPGSGSSFPLGPDEAGGALYVLASDGISTGQSQIAPEQVWMLPDPAAPDGAAATTTLMTSAPAVATGGSVTLTATVTAADPTQPTPTGEVVFRDDNQIYGSAPLVNGTATLVASISAPGPDNLTAVYTGDSVFDESISAPTTVTAGMSGTTLGLTTSAATANSGQAVTFTATVIPALNAPQPPSGLVSFLDGKTVLGIGVVTAGVASFQTNSLTAGSHTITAVYSGDSTFSPSSSAAVTETVATSFTVNLQAPPPTTTFGKSLTLLAQVAPSAGSTLMPGMMVIFRDAATPLGTGLVNSAGLATFTVGTLSAGAHSISAVVFSGGNEFDSTASAVVVQPGATTATVRSTAPTAGLGQTVTLTMTIATPGPGLPAATGNVTFKDGSVVLGTDAVANSRAVLLVPNLAVGNHAITATYSGDSNYLGSSAAMSQTVTPLAVKTTTVIQPPVTTALVGQQVALSAAVLPSVGTATPVGSVTFRDGAALLGSVKIDPTGHALLLISSLGIGNHAITATFGGADIFTGSTSAPVTVAVRYASTASLTASTGTIVSGQAVALTAKMAATAPGSIEPAGNVTFYEGTTVLGTAALQNGIAKFTTGPLTVVGNQKLTAVYSGNGLFASANTNAVYVTVRSIGTNTVIETPTSPAPGTGLVALTANIGVVAPGTGSASGKVTFYSGNSAIGSAPVIGGIATLHLPKPAAGSYYLRAVFSGTGAFANSSSAIIHYTIAATTSTTLQANAAAFGQTTNLKATVTALSPGAGKASGKVVFKDGTTVLGSATLLNGVASLGVKLSTGPHDLTATYAGTGDFAGSAAVPMVYNVTKASPVLALKASPAHPVIGNTVTITASAGPATAGAAGPTGSILLMNGTAIVGVGTITGGVVIVHTTKLTPGTHVLKATYTGDVNYLAASETLSVTVA